MSTTKPASITLADFTITLNGLADAGARESTVVNFSSDRFLDAIVELQITLATGATTADTARIEVYAYGGARSGHYTDNVTGADANITLRSRLNLFHVTTIQTPDNLAAAAAWKCIIPSIAMAFGGVLPPYWGLVIQNLTGRAFHSSGNVAKYAGLNAQTV